MRQFYILLVILNLNACASFYNIEASKPATVYIRPTAVVTDFNISGRFSIKNKEKNYYGNLTWSRTGNNEALDFNSPIGQTFARIVIESNNVTLTTNKDTYTGDDLDNMMIEELGFTLPLNYLHYWIQGVEFPNELITETLNNGFIQLGWRVEYLEWQDKTHAKIIMCSKGDLIIKLLLEW